MFNENGNDIVHFNVGDYVNKCEGHDQFIGPPAPLKVTEKVCDQVLKRGYESISLNAWSYECASAVHHVKRGKQI